MGFSFEKLTVWQDAIELTGSVHQLTLSFPKEELYVLTSQIKRASDSIALNIAEGSTGQSDKEFNRFLGIALRSGIEVVSCLYIAKRRDIINEKTFLEYYQTIEKLIIKIQALRKTLRG
ncbi:MAG: four helix bundle protein [Flavobacteriales bacterium]|nr:four helix bundle protein [Flavobacteriales bacterium]